MRQDRQRLDKWLWFARFAKTRATAARLIEAGHVRVDGRRIVGAGHGLKLGDVLTLALPHATIVVRLLSLGERRGPYEQARLLYERLEAEARGDAPLAVIAPDGY
ncbi:RNA-binding S4 domain-containing protein [Bosea sp. PAMC 26642]|uniref:RNA-binding S4 domain-containing protein n=1 Tax=Bosea sp. (strain PAMC 26642) TaxID=1792307 RepID=UPI000770141A|nr:RNA-binding S4 domain-containing protein [Bosea sp. PAMC 26642]AMJ61866.1 RNA-binding protein [Bosea sp. PAMC 26642]